MGASSKLLKLASNRSRHPSWQDQFSALRPVMLKYVTSSCRNRLGMAMNIDVEVLEWTTRLGKCPCYPMRPSVTLLCAYIGAQVISSSQVAKLTGPRLSGTLMSEGNHNVSTYARLRPRPFLALPCDACFSRSNCVPYYWSQPIANSRPIRAQGKSPNNFYTHDGQHR